MNAVKYSAWREQVVIVSLLVLAWWELATWQAVVADTEIELGRNMVISLCVSLVGGGFVAGMRQAVHVSSGYNLMRALEFYNCGNREEAFLVLFDPKRPLGPGFVKSECVQRLLWDVLREVVGRTSVSEAKTDPAVTEMLEKFGGKIVAAELTSKEISSLIVKAGRQRQSLLVILAVASALNALLALIKMIGGG